MTYCKILLVEDETVTTLEMRRRLRSLGYGEPLTASCGKDAVALTLTERPDLVLMDIMLGDGPDGIETAGSILALHSVPVIYMTAHEDPEILQRAKVTEPFGYLIKPVEDRDLRSAIEMALYKHQVDHEVRRKERWFATTLGTIADGVLTVDRHGRITYINASAAHLTGATPSACIDRVFAEHVDIRVHGDGPRLSDPNDRLEQPELHDMEEALVLGPDGAHRPIELRVSALLDPDGHRVGAVLVFRDITERLRSEDALRHSVENLRRMLRQTVSALTTASEKRDPYTAGHQARVAELALALGTRLGLPADRLEGLHIAGLLHDIGKIHIPAEILAKPSMLSDLEMGIIRTHSSVGHDILKGIEFPWPVADIALQHHERLDGSGYPSGISGEALLPETRILTVADVVDAMSSHRPYRAALGTEAALGEITEGRGTRYQPEVVDACITLFREGFQFSEPSGPQPFATRPRT